MTARQRGLITTMQGWYRLRVGVPGQRTRLDSGWFPNLITDAGLNRLGIGTCLDLCAVGTDSTPPSASDNSLVATLATTTQILSSTAGAQSAVPYYGYRRLAFYFEPGEATGNIAEIGVGWAGGLFSRALTVDDNGDPAVVTVLANEGLEVTYEIRLYPPAADDSYTATLAGISRACVARAALVTSGNVSAGWGMGTGPVANSATDSAPIAYDGALGSVTASPSGNLAVCTSRGTASYVNNSHQLDLTATWGLTAANFAAGVQSVLLYTQGLGAYQISFDPPIPKTDATQLVMTFTLSWARR